MYSYLAFCGFAKHFVLPRTQKLAAKSVELENVFRAMHGRVAQNAEAIAIHNGIEREKELVDGAWLALLRHSTLSSYLTFLSDGPRYAALLSVATLTCVRSLLCDVSQVRRVDCRLCHHRVSVCVQLQAGHARRDRAGVFAEHAVLASHYRTHEHGEASLGL
jgi:hypothetical protein